MFHTETEPSVLPPAVARIARDGASAIFEVLRDWNIDLVFTCPGSTEAAVLDASLDYPEMRLVLTTHESIAVAAADGFARVSGRPAVAYLHANVGLANGIAHLACALTTQSPVVVLNGLKSTKMANRGGYTTSPFQMDHIRQYVRSARITMRDDAIAEDLTRTLQAATTDPGGPVYLGLAQDLVEQARDVAIPPVAQYRFSSRRRPDPATVAAAARLLDRHEAVTIVAGSEIARGDARRALLALADRLDAPVLIEDRRTLAAAGITGDWESFAGTYAPDHPAIVASDVILLAGMASFMEFEPHPVSVLPARAKVIHLYNDPAEIAKVERADVGLVGDMALALDDLLAGLAASAAPGRRAHRVSAVTAFQTEYEKRQRAARARYGEQPVHPLVLCHALNDALPSDCFIVGDAVTSNGYAMDALIPASKREFITTTGGSLGWGMGAALGVKLARRDARVVSVIGDGVFQFGVQALWTASALGLAVTFIVIDNGSYAAVKAALKRFRVRAALGEKSVFPGSEIGGPDIASIAAGFGAYAETVNSVADVGPALDRAFSFAGPSVVVVKTDSTHTGP